MATTQKLEGVDQIKGPAGSSNLRLFQFAVYVGGTYLTATKPTFNILTFMQQGHEGLSTVTVVAGGVLCFRDYYDGTNTYTAPNAYIVLANVNSGCTNDRVTFRIDSAATNGSTGSEIADATALSNIFVFEALLSYT